MSEVVNRRRSYDSSRRKEQAAENRARVLRAASSRFLEDGYATATIPAIAADAGVSTQTVYKAFGNKAALLKSVFDVAVVGDEEPVPMVERDEIKRIQADPDARTKLRSYAAFYVKRAQHAVRFQLLARDAAANDPAAAEVWAQMTNERLVGMTRFARHLADGGHLRAGLTVEDARDVLWTFISPQLWELLVVNRGWTPQHYAKWMAEMLAAALLPPAG